MRSAHRPSASSFDLLGGRDPAGHRIDLGVRAGRQSEPGSTVRVDATGLTVAPGLIDLQVNGAFGYDLTREPDRMWEVGRRLAATGVTAFCPTVITAPHEQVVAAQAAIGGRPADYVGAEPIGLHIEGPHLSSRFRGVHDADLLRSATDSPLTPDGTAILTVAPEVEGAIALIRRMVDAGVLVSIGHTGAGADTVRAALDAGATMGTHVLNGMPPIGARDPGPAGTLLSDPRAFIGMIVDGHHHADEVVRLVWAAAAARLILVSDAMAAMGMPDGEYRLGGREVTVVNGIARDREGALAGATRPLVDSLALLDRLTRAPTDALVATVTRTPARALGLPDRGRLGRGRADLTLLDGWSVAGTVVGGVVAHLAEPDRLTT